MEIRRRDMIAGTAGTVSSLCAFSLAHSLTSRHDPSASSRPDIRPFYGKHQPGILGQAPPYACYVAYDVTTHAPGQLVELFRVLTERIIALMAAHPPLPVGISAPPSDSGVLGAEPVPDGLNISVGVGHSLFNQRFGLHKHCPAHLVPMKSFRNDDLNLNQCHGDILLQIQANHSDGVLHALRDINRHTRSAMQMRWKQEGSISPPRPAGTPRNHFGFKDGTSNPDVSDPAIAHRLIWTGKDDLPWTKNGTYQVVRLITMLTEFWDRISLSEQESIIGRNRATGAPLDGDHEHDAPRYLNDATGAAIPLNSHIRLANPRDKDSEDNRIFRRGYNYSNGIAPNGNLDMGLIFTCYQQNISRQFETIQLRLQDEPLTDYVIPVGGGYFFMLPGITRSSDFFGRELFHLSGIL